MLSAAGGLKGGGGGLWGLRAAWAGGVACGDRWGPGEWVEAGAARARGGGL